MAQPGRKSAAKVQAELNRQEAEAHNNERPKPPASFNLNSEEKQVWNDTLARLPANWVAPVAYPLFAQYCRSVAQVKWMSCWVKEAQRKKDPHELGKAMRLEALATRSMRSIATTLKLHGTTLGAVKHRNLLAKQQKMNVPLPVEDSPWKDKSSWKSNKPVEPASEDDEGTVQPAAAADRTDQPWD